MTIHQTRTAPSRRVPPAAHQPGPVTLAIRGVRPNSLPSWEMREQQLADERRALAALRKRIEDQIEADQARIERCLNALDIIDGDADFEEGAEAEPWLGSLAGTATWPDHSQLAWGGGGTADVEAVNEDGGDIQDEPHDAEEDDDRDSGVSDMEGAIEQYGERTGCFAVFA